MGAFGKTVPNTVSRRAPLVMDQPLRKHIPMQRFSLLSACICLSLAAAGPARAESYSPEAASMLRFMVEEEKLAGDVYEAFFALYPLDRHPNARPFGNIMKSEDQHVAALVTQAGLAGVDVGDLTALPKGQFQNTALQSLYAALVARGGASLYDALAVGRDIEIQDIADLEAAMSGVPAGSSLHSAYDQLKWASNNHLRAFNSHLAATTPPIPEPGTHALMLAGLGLVVAARARAAKSAPVLS